MLQLLLSNSGLLVISDVSLTDNRASESGGAVYASGIAQGAQLSRVNISGNRALLGSGGAVFASNVNTLSISDVQICSNVAGESGGAVSASNSNVLIHTNVNVSNNSAAKDGGAVYSFAGQTLTLYDINITGNSAVGSGGAVGNVGSIINSPVKHLCHLFTSICL